MDTTNFALRLLLLGLSAAGCFTEEIKPSYRLPGDIIPQHYYLRILTNLADLNPNFTFSGDVAIRVEVLSDTNKIVLHSRNLTIDENKVRVVSAAENGVPNPCEKSNADTQNVKVNSHTYDGDLDYYMINTDEKLQKSKIYFLCIPFEGIITKGLAGYYRSSYKDQVTGETRWLAVTQFESTDARRAFPCFDEPAMKAKFEVTMGHVKSKSAVSNMPVASTKEMENMEGWVWDQFEVTVPMSTYLLAFMVSDFVSVDSPRSQKNDVRFSVWARKDASTQLNFAADIGPKILEDYEAYFDIKYPLPKQDMVAIPDFSAGAMENWGLITYRETALLVDPKFTSATNLPHIASVVAHELAHQWFGNLVTMKWWTDLWLNEGFATYVATQETHKLHPEWNYADDQLVKNLMSVLELDSLKSSHPISVPVGHPREIAEIFDTISYKKGSYILSMMNRFLGEDTFRKGVSKYLKRHAFNNAEQDHLWIALTEEAHENKVLPTNMTVKEIMDTWTLQTGYPLLTVSRAYDQGTATVSQERFLADASHERSESNATWWVPLTYTTSSELDFNTTTPKKWLPAGQKETTLTGIPEKDWLLFNVKLSGLYRINYDEQNWNKLAETLNSDSYDSIHMLNRVQLIDDSFDLASIGLLDYSIPLQILKYLPREKEYLPWRGAMIALGKLDRLLHDHSLYGPFRSYVKSLVTPIYNLTSQQELEDTPSNLQRIELKRLAAGWACMLNIADCRAKAVHQFRHWMTSADPDKENPIPKNDRSNVYCYAVKEGGEDEWSFAWKRYLKSNVGAHKSELLRALSCTTETWLLNRYLRWAINETSGIKRQDSRTVFTAVSRNDLGYFLAKAFFTQNIDLFRRHHGAKTDALSHYFKALASHVTSEAELNEVGAKAEVHNCIGFGETTKYKILKYIDLRKKNEELLRGGKQGIEQALEAARIGVTWHQRFYVGVAKFFADPRDNTIDTE